MSVEAEPRTAVPRGSEYRALVDAHVHLHPGFDQTRFFGAAMRNFAAAARELDLGTTGAWESVLVLTEVAGRNVFQDLRSRAGGPLGQEALRVAETGDATSVRVEDPARSESVIVVGGRQIQTAERLEVLAFPLADEVPDGVPVATALASVARRGACAMIPWGPGKWSFGRGRLLERLMSDRDTGDVRFLLADTGHRPAWAPGPRRLRRWVEAGEPALTGSDPLPLWGEGERAGSCCFEIVLTHSGRGPAHDLLRALLGEPVPRLRRVERRPGLASFVAKQIAMQARKRLVR